MKKTRLYILTLIAISIVVLIISIASSYYLYNAAKGKLWESKLESGERETREIANLLEQQLNSGLTKEQVIQNLQKSIENTDFKSDFICMYNQKGIELCHPNPALIGKIIQDNNSELKGIKGKKNNTFRAVLQAGKKDNGLRTFSNNPLRSSEIVTVYPVLQTDWMVASHANLKVLQDQLSDLYLQFLVSLLLSTLIISLSCYILIRFIYSNYERSMESEIKALNDQVNELQILNKQLSKYQGKLQDL
ncbi:MAG: LytTR family transcriptional regulator, partial [Flavobacterium sp.]